MNSRIFDSAVLRTTNVTPSIASAKGSLGMPRSNGSFESWSSEKWTRRYWSAARPDVICLRFDAGDWHRFAPKALEIRTDLEALAMSNSMKYIKDLEAAGFRRNQAEAQVQMVLDAIEGDLVTKAEFAVFQERIENRLVQTQQQIQGQIKESEFRLVTRLGLLTVSAVSIAVAMLTWLIKI